jgi:hypothetical protein
MSVYIYPSGKRVKYDDGKTNWKYIEVPDPDLAALDHWDFEESLIERRRRRKKYNRKAAVIAREVEARNRQLQQEEERAIAEYMRDSERKFWKSYGDLFDPSNDPDTSLERVVNRGEDGR